ncbi:glycoside hydrolase family 20 zincin-like fold domain-containing protein [Saccharicrinis sp. GN24d3]|uniref:glycoside hydrolase family 20 zincin-like fold domain-containing protein n=1 Tax=Saccharicrinis sp. GN24d3 TaxID=3458416 RepID=UPI004036CDEF
MLRIFILWIAMISSLSLFAQNKTRINLIPYPQSLEVNKGLLTVKNGVSVRTDNVTDQSLSHLFLEQLKNEVKVVKSGTKLRLELLSNAKQEKKEEWYKLIIDRRGIKISAYTPAGLLYGISTLNQIFYQSRTEVGYQIPFLQITDQPAYTYRGFMLDSSRHIQSVDGIKGILDFMVTLN